MLVPCQCTNRRPDGGGSRQGAAIGRCAGSKSPGGDDNSGYGVVKQLTKHPVAAALLEHLARGEREVTDRNLPLMQERWRRITQQSSSGFFKNPPPWESLLL